MEKHDILSRYTLSKNDLAVKIYWQPSMCLHLPRPPAPAHHIIPHTCCCAWNAASSGWLLRPFAALSAGDLPAPSVRAQAFLPPPGSREQLTVGVPPESTPHALSSHFISYLSFWLCCPFQLRNGLPYRAQHTLAQVAQPCHLLKHAHRNGVQG